MKIHVSKRLICLKTAFIICMFGGSGHLLYSQTYINLNINQPASLQADAGADTTICLDDSTTLGGAPTAINGTAPFSYSWSPATGLSSTNTANPMASPPDTTTYIVTTTDANNCVQTDTIVLSVEVCIGIAENGSNIGIGIFPNPNEGSFVLSISGREMLGEVLFEIVNPIGQIVYSEQLSETASGLERQIGINAFAKGMYIVKVRSNNTSFVQKFIVQ